MARWLFKEEPGTYNYAALVRDGRTVWSGVKNALALKHLRAVAKGDVAFFYHTGKEKGIVGIMRAVKTEADEVHMAPVHSLKRSVTLQEIKAEPALAGWELVRMSRLSVMPVTEGQWQRILEMSEQ